MDVLTQTLEDILLENDTLLRLTFLSLESEQNKAIEAAIRSILKSLTTQTIFEETAMEHGMHKYIWEGRFCLSFVTFAKIMVAKRRREHSPVWLAHVLQEERLADSLSLHDGTFSFDVSECSLGALIGPFTCCSHVNWKESDYRLINATFDFDEDMLRVEFKECRQHSMWKLEINFDELKRAFLVQPKIEDGDAAYSFYIYLSSVPSFWQVISREDVFSRIVYIPDAERADVGKCSVLKLDLKSVIEDKLVTLLDKLYASEFNVWWTSLDTISPRAQSVDEARVPWSVHWLLSEGYRISDQLSVVDMDVLYKHEHILYSVFKGVISREIIVNVMEELKLFLQQDAAHSVDKMPPQNLRDNYTLIRKVLVTPTRVIYLSPEPVPMNRVLRNYDPGNFIMVLFRDENMHFLEPISAPALEAPIARFKAFLLDGFEAEGRTYVFLGCSSDQLRAYSCWMYAEDPTNGTTVEEIRRWMGHLADIQCVALYVSGLGQFLSPSVKTLDLSREKYKITEIPDVERNRYCFTDGIGKISKDVAEEVANEYGLKSPSSAFQILLGGCKGILVIDPQLARGEVHIRPSMKHFDSSHKVLEVVDCSRPQGAHLDRQIITLMSQLGIPDDTFLRFQDEYLHRLLEMFTSNERARLELDEMQTVFDIRQLGGEGIDLASDAFFRSLLLVRYQDYLHGLLENMHIPLPLDMGRVLMGVVDETDQLKSGQVFIQYSKDIHNPEDGVSVLTGDVMVTKTPCLHPRDLRLFEAVDCPQLHHLVDCLVFPIQGDRPHRSEISGVDRDPDLYWTTWHPDLILQDTQWPMSRQPVILNMLQHTPTQDDVIEYFTDSVKHTNIDQLIEVHLAHAHLEKKGIFSSKCLELARLHSVPVQFAESPITVSELKPTQFPDFMMKKNNPKEISKTILGKLYRHVSLLVTMTDLHMDTVRELWKDKTCSPYRNRSEFEEMIIPEIYQKQAGKYYEHYAGQIQRILAKYGIEDEYHLFARSIRNMKNSTLLANDRQELVLLVQTEIRQLKKYYSNIFEEQDHSEALPTKTVAWYNIAYKEGRLKSFAWIASSVPRLAVATKSTSLVCVDTADLKNRVHLTDIDDEIKFFLECQASAKELFLREIYVALPNLNCSLIPTDLEKWHIPSRDVYIQLHHSSRSKLEQEFAELCVVILNLDISGSGMNYDNPGCYITNREISKKVVVEGQDITVHVYYGDILGTVLEGIASIVTSELLSECLQILTQFWVLYSNRNVQNNVSVLHICELALFFLKKVDDSATLFEVVHGFLKYFTDIDTLLEYRRSSSLLDLELDDLRLLQSSFLGGLQILLLYGTHVMLNHSVKRIGNRIFLKRIAMSTKPLWILDNEKKKSAKWLGSNSGCRIGIRIKRLHDETTGFYIIEGFGDKQQCIKIKETASLLLNLFTQGCKYMRLPSDRNLIFEGSTNEDDAVVTMPYHKCSYFPPHFIKHYLAVQPVSGDVQCEQNLRNAIDQYCRIIDAVRPHYNEHFHGPLRVVCRFTNFHYSTRFPRQIRTVGEFQNLCNQMQKEVSSNHQPAPVDIDMLIRVLQKHAFELDRTAPGTITISVTVQTSSGVKNVIYNENLEIQNTRETSLNVTLVEYIRKMRSIPGQGKQEKMADIYIRLQARRFRSDLDTDSLSFITDSDYPLIVFDDDQPPSDSDDMPYLKVHPKYLNEVEFIRQCKTTTYRYPSSTIAQNLDHFTAHVEVEVSEIRDYNFKANQLDEFCNACIKLQTLPPLRCRAEHRHMAHQILNLALEMGDSFEGVPI